MVRYFVDASATAYRLLPRFASEEDFYMNHVMLLDMLWMVVLGSVEYDISRLHFVSFEFDWQGIKLVSLITWTKLKAEFVSQIVNCPPNKSAAVQEKWGVVQGVIRLAIPFSVWNP